MPFIAFSVAKWMPAEPPDAPISGFRCSGGHPAGLGKLIRRKVKSGFFAPDFVFQLSVISKATVIIFSISN